MSCTFASTSNLKPRRQDLPENQPIFLYPGPVIRYLCAPNQSEPRAKRATARPLLPAGEGMGMRAGYPHPLPSPRANEVRA